MPAGHWGKGLTAWPRLRMHGKRLALLRRQPGRQDRRRCASGGRDTLQGGMRPGNGGFRLEATLISHGRQQGAIGRIGDRKTGAGGGAPGAILPAIRANQIRRERLVIAHLRPRMDAP